jgi:hypothetical protein
MALNPPIDEDGNPRPIPGEGGFRVNSVEVQGNFKIAGSNAKYSGRGR